MKYIGQPETVIELKAEHPLFLEAIKVVQAESPETIENIKVRCARETVRRRIKTSLCLVLATVAGVGIGSYSWQKFEAPVQAAQVVKDTERRLQPKIDIQKTELARQANLIKAFRGNQSQLGQQLSASRTQLAQVTSERNFSKQGWTSSIAEGNAKLKNLTEQLIVSRTQNASMRKAIASYVARHRTKPGQCTKEDAALLSITGVGYIGGSAKTTCRLG